MPHHFHSNLVVANPKCITFCDSPWVCWVSRRHQRLEMVVRIRSRHACERQDALFGEQVIQFELAHFDVEPTAAEEIVEARPNGFEVKCPGIVRGWQNIKRKILG